MSPASELAVETAGLVKHFGDTKAVDGIDLAVRAGTVYGVLGPNGAGKTTAVRMLATLLTPTAGQARVLGRDVVTEAEAVRRDVALTGQMASVDEELTGVENLVLLGRLLGFSSSLARGRADDLLDAFGLVDAADRLVKEYSGGMRRRLDIAASIVTTPRLLFLDEPTTGLDPRSRNQVWDIVRALVGAGTTVLLTTQYLEEADQLADRIAIIDHGKVIAEGTSSELKASVGSGGLRVRLRDPALRADAEVILARTLDRTVLLESDPAELSAAAGGTGDANRAIAALAEAGIEVGEFAYGQPSLDEVFLALTGHPADDQPQMDTEDEIDDATEEAVA
jgi:ABC-2 type transport system ATP-binding protein